MKKFLIANWKENKNSLEITAFFETFVQNYQEVRDLTVVICPSYLYLEEVSDLIKKHQLKGVFCGAQNVSLEKSGAHTGSVSAQQLKDFCTYCIVGHSETGDDLKTAQQKAELCVENGVIPFVCLKDTEAFRAELEPGSIRVWEDPMNISQGGVYKDILAEDFEARALQIREVAGEAEPVIYGGSVNPENVESLLKSRGNFCGFLVGHASLDPLTFISLSEKIGI